MELFISIFENSSPKGSFRQNEINYEILQLQADSRYLQSGPLKFQRRDGNENVKITKQKQYVKTTTLHVHQTFLCDYVVKMPNFKFYEERKRTTAKFSMDMVVSVTTFDKVKWVEIIAIKSASAQIYSRLALQQQLSAKF